MKAKGGEEECEFLDLEWRSEQKTLLT